MKGYQEGIIAHYEKAFKKTSDIYLWDKGPIERLPVEFRVSRNDPLGLKDTVVRGANPEF